MDNLFCLKRNEKSIHFLFYKEFYSWAKNIQKIISDTILFSFSKKIDLIRKMKMKHGTVDPNFANQTCSNI